MNNSATALERLLVRSYKCEGDTYCTKLSPNVLYKEEWSLRLTDLIEASKDRLISNFWIAAEERTAYWTVTAPGWLSLGEMKINFV